MGPSLVHHCPTRNEATSTNKPSPDIGPSRAPGNDVGHGVTYRRLAGAALFAFDIAGGALESRPAMEESWVVEGHRLTHQIVDVGRGVGLEIVEAGSGSTTLVVAPGFGSGIGSYGAFIEELAHDFSVVGFSPRGFGRSGWASPYVISGWVDDLVDVVRYRAQGPVVAVGHSFGALLALAAAAVEPARIRAVISLDQIIELDEFRPRAKQLNGFWQQIRLAAIDAEGNRDTLAARLADLVADDGQIDRLATRWSRQDPAVLESLTDERFDEWLSDPVLDDLPGRVRCPVLCVNGDPGAGSIVSDAQGVRNLAAYPGSVQVRLDGVDHGLGLDEKPAPIVDAMRAFLTNLR